jgi:hypothetical protein
MGKAENERIVGAALRDAYARRQLTGKPEGFRVVQDLIVTMDDIFVRKQIQDRADKAADDATDDRSPVVPRDLRSWWPKSADEAKRSIDLDALAAELQKRSAERVSNGDVELAKAIRTVLRAALPNPKTLETDWALLTWVALWREAGKSQREIAARLDEPYPTVAKMDSVRGRAQDIWNAVEHLMSDRAGTGSGRVLKVGPLTGPRKPRFGAETGIPHITNA